MLISITEISRNIPSWLWFTLFGILVLIFELFMMKRYRLLAEKAEKYPVIAPIIFSGSFHEGFTESAKDSLLNEMDEVIKIFKNMREGFDTKDAPIEIGKEFCTLMALSSRSLNLVPSEHPTDYKFIEDQLRNIKIKVEWIEVPLNSFINLIIWILLRIPVPYRNNYLRRLIHVKFVSTKDEYQIRVYRKDKTSKRPLEFTNIVTKNTKESKPLRETAFMILELHGKAFKGLRWRGMLHFTYGLDQLIKYFKKPDLKLLKKAKLAFNNAIKADKFEHEARCFLGALLVAERTKKSISKAIWYFEEALQTDRPRFKAFVHAGLAHCYAQQYHRLAQRSPEIREKAREQANIAESIWEKTREKPEPWIQYTLAMTMVIDEGEFASTLKELKNMFIPAINLCLLAIDGDKKNKLFYNTLGWMLLKMAENDVLELTIKDGISKKFVGNVAKKAEHYLKESIEFNSENKLSHANLCLLYASSSFRKKPEIYKKKCIFYGKKAIKIDPDYINGYRDLAVSLIRYKEFDQAHEYYLMALNKAPYIEKDLEIIDDIIRVLDEVKADNALIIKFQNPPQELLMPPTN